MGWIWSGVWQVKWRCWSDSEGQLKNNSLTKYRMQLPKMRRSQSRSGCRDLWEVIRRSPASPLFLLLAAVSVLGWAQSSTTATVRKKHFKKLNFAVWKWVNLPQVCSPAVLLKHGVLTGCCGFVAQSWVRELQEEPCRGGSLLGPRRAQGPGLCWVLLWHRFVPGKWSFSCLPLLYLAGSLEKSPVGAARLQYLSRSFDWFEHSGRGPKARPSHFLNSKARDWKKRYRQLFSCSYVCVEISVLCSHSDALSPHWMSIKEMIFLKIS